MYSESEKIQRLQNLLTMPRVFGFDLNYENGVNCVSGLLDLCAKYVKDTDLIVEVGSCQGVSSRTIALHCKNLYCVDPWSWAAVVEAEKIFDSMLSDYPNIKKIKSTSYEASKLFTDHSLDLVYIDGDHSYQSVVQDIKTWLPKIKSGGYIAGHDNYIDDVRRAVCDIFGENYETFSDTSWIVTVKSDI